MDSSVRSLAYSGYIKIMEAYPRLTKEEFSAFLKQDRAFVKRYNLTISLTRRVGYGLIRLSNCKFDGMFGFAVDREEALKHYDKSCIYYPKIKERYYTRTAMENYRSERKRKFYSLS